MSANDGDNTEGLRPVSPAVPRYRTSPDALRCATCWTATRTTRRAAEARAARAGQLGSSRTPNLSARGCDRRGRQRGRDFGLAGEFDDSWAPWRSRQLPVFSGAAIQPQVRALLTNNAMRLMGVAPGLARVAFPLRRFSAKSTTSISSCQPSRAPRSALMPPAPTIDSRPSDKTAWHGPGRRLQSSGDGRGGRCRRGGEHPSCTNLQNSLSSGHVSDAACGDTDEGGLGVIVGRVTGILRTGRRWRRRRRRR
jgi:hypothetical protein